MSVIDIASRLRDAKAQLRIAENAPDHETVSELIGVCEHLIEAVEAIHNALRNAAMELTDAL
jgi:hypothetical protein